jgi:putative nucleotidyltransferase with HDIG domain
MIRPDTYLEMIDKFCANLRRTQSIEAVVAASIDTAFEAIGATAGVIWLNHRRRDETLFIIARNWFTAIVDLTNGPSGLVSDNNLSRGHTFFSSKLVLDSQLGQASFCDVPADWGVVSVPLRVDLDINGLLIVSFKPDGPIGKKQLDLLTLLAQVPGSLIHQHRLGMSLASVSEGVLKGWTRALDFTDGAMYGHTQRVVEVALQLARKMGVAQDQLLHFRRGALLHDIGKLAIPDAILLKPGPLSDRERQIVQKHPIIASAMLSRIDFAKPTLDIPRYHHENWDGSGYPVGLKGAEIPLAARIFSVVDVWDALSSSRPYRAPWEEGRVLDYINGRAGMQFDPQVIEEFFNMDLGPRHALFSGQ